jgi:hypothetical protein
MTGRPAASARGPGLAARLVLIAWMALVALAFVAVSLAPEGPVAALAPEALLQARALLLPLFHAPSAY